MSSSPAKIEPSAKAPEPSMEEILASIRKIISDDDAKPAPAVAPASPRAAEPVVESSPEPKGQDDIDALLAGFDMSEHEGSEPQILELTEDMAASQGGFEASDLDFVEAPPRPAEPAPPEIMPAMMPEKSSPPPRPAPSSPASFEERLISAATDSAISSAFGSLTHTILSQNARTLDDLVQEMLRPMLKSWLDDNLPALVERLVRAEIERVSRGGR
jgi:uncharacterized protein